MIRWRWWSSAHFRPKDEGEKRKDGRIQFVVVVIQSQAMQVALKMIQDQEVKEITETVDDY
jgi:hypothetical protein